MSKNASKRKCFFGKTDLKKRNASVHCADQAAFSGNMLVTLFFLTDVSPLSLFDFILWPCLTPDKSILFRQK